MAVVTVPEVKQFLQITDNATDALIDMLIPVAQETIIAETNNWFKMSRPLVQHYAQTLAFVVGNPATITDSGNGFVTSNFFDQMHIVVENSVRNNGIYQVATVAAGTLTLKSGELLKTELAGQNVFITGVEFPAPLKRVAAGMVKYLMDISDGLSSESIGDYSAVYDFRTRGGFPEKILDQLKPWKRFNVGPLPFPQPVKTTV